MMRAQQRILENAFDFPCPVLLAHGSADRLAPLSAVEGFFENLGPEDKAFHVFPGAYHELHNDECRDEVFTLYRDWILARL